MDNHKAQTRFLSVLLTGAGIIVALIFWPFVYALILALIFAVAYWPFHQRVLKLFGQYPSLAALFSTLLIIVFILTPLLILGGQIFVEARQLYLSLAENSGREVIINLLQSVTEKIQRIFPEVDNFSLSFDEYLKQVATWLVRNLGAIFSNFASLLVDSFIFLLAFYYLLRDGQKLKSIVMNFSPLPSAENEAILNKLELAINSVVRGNLAIALIQGVLASTGLTIFGVPNPVLWGMVAAICSLIPGFGTSLVVLPAVAYLFLSNQIVAAIGLLIWGMVVVGLVDNFLGPRLVGRGMKLHPLMVILAVLGGAAFFGPIGFLLGPLTLGLFFSLFDICASLVKKG